MKIRYTLLLIFGAACRADEVKWMEKEIYTVSFVKGSENSLVKIKAATPELAGYAGFFCDPGNRSATRISGIRTEGVTPGRLDAWEKVEIGVPQKFLDAALAPEDSWWQSLALTGDPVHRNEKPLCQWGNSIYIVLKPESRDRNVLHPKIEWAGFQITGCAPEARNNQLPILYSRITDPSRNLAPAFFGLLDVGTGRVSEVLQGGASFSGDDQAGWINDQRIAITACSRYGESGVTIDLAKKKVDASLSIPGAARWLIADGHLLAWHLHPGVIPVGSRE
ncbi:MAG TPA: hypothetical protein VHM91_01295 [Verrucomicrobiales bacterium]|nr:hypothetical protein [Verrucomicrobiales bacterium]